MTNSYTTGPNLFRKFLFASFMLALSVLFSVSSWGQLGANYTFSASAGTYSSISATGTAVGAAILVDDGSVNITGLTPGFTVNGVTYTNARMNSNGWLALYATTAPTSTTGYAAGAPNALSASMTNGAVILAPFNADQNGTGKLAWRQTISGVHIFEWQNFLRFNSTGEVLNYQVRLNTTNGSISFVYGTMTFGTSSVNPQVGFKTTGTVASNWATDVNNLQMNVTGSPNTCTWADAVTGNANNSTMYFNNLNPAVKPASGLTFTWTPQASPAPVRTFSAVSAITQTGATLAWTAPTGATSYEVQYRAVGQCGWTNFSGNPVASATATLTGLNPLTSYQIRVRSSNGSAFSIWSHIPSSAAGAGTNGYAATGTFTTLAPPPTVSSIFPTSGCAGASLTITGTNLTGATAANVTVGGTAVSSITSNDGSTLVVVIGSGTTGTVSVTTTGGTGTGGTFTFDSPPTPGTPATTGLSTSGFTANWTASAGATSYILDVSTVNTFGTYVSGFNGLTLGTVTSYAVTGLSANTTYYWRVRAASACVSGNTATQTVFTGYCVPTSNCTFGDVIASVSLNTLSNTTGTTCGGGGYSNYTTNPALTTTLLPSATYTVTVGANAYAQSVAVWIDYNDDLVFDNVTERVGATAAGSPVPVNGTASFSITLGCTPPAGVHRMRIRSSDNSFVTGPAQTPCTTYSYGETEDYNITIQAAPACLSTGALSASVASSTSANLTWSVGCATATNIDIEYGPTGFTPGSGTLLTEVAATILSGNGSYSLTGLSENTGYQVRMRANCGGSVVSSWTNLASFATPCSSASAGATGTILPTSLACDGSIVSAGLGAGASSGASFSFQWQSSADGTTYSNISGATSASYTSSAAVTAATYYKCVVTCIASAASSTSTPLFVDAPFSTPSVVAVPPLFCGTGGTSTLTATISGANPYDTFTWAAGAGQPGVLSNETSTTADWTVTQSAGFTYTAVDTETGCTKVVSQSVNVLDGVSPTPAATPSIVCTGGTTSLASGLSAATFSSTPIAHNPISAGVSNTLAAGGVAVVPQTTASLDDGGWADVPLGFTFSFFGTNYTTCHVGTNGNVMFGTYNGSFTGLGDFTFTTLPSASEPRPMIAILAMDNNLVSGAIRYRTLGFPGNRIFVLAYENVQEYGDTQYSTATLHIYEATGIVEVHVTSSTNVDRVKVVGVNGPTGLIGTLAYQSTGTAGNAAVGTGLGGVTLQNPIASPFAFRFTPPQDYTCAWTPSSDISGAATGTNLFSRTTNALNTPGVINFNLNLTNQQTGCVSNVAIPVTVVDPPSTPVSASVQAYGSSLGSSSATQTPLTVCGVQNVKLVYVGALGSTDQVKWYSAASGGTLLATNDTLDIAGLSANDTVWVAINNGACAESVRFQYEINYNTAPTASVTSLGPDNDVNCGEGPTYGMSYSMTSAASPAYTYTWSNDGNATTFTDNGGGSATLTATETTTSSWSAFQPGTGCATNGQKSFGIYPFPVIVPTAADTAICIGDTTQIFSNLSTTNFSVKCVPFSYRTAPVGAIDLCRNGTRNASYGGTASLDDGGWNSVPLGFTFNFFGSDFTSVNVGTNGVINFGPYASFNVGQFSFPSGFPSPSSPANTIGVLATDFYMTTSGHVTFWTEGAAPNRIFVIEYQGPGWQTDGNLRAQCHLYETLGLVEIHVDRATATGTFAGPKTIGLQNGAGTIGATAPVVCDVNGNQVGIATWNARNSTIAASASQAWRFSPPVSYTFAWLPAAQIAGSTTGSTALAAPTATTPGVQSYTVTVTDNLSGCVGTPVELEFDLIAPVAAPDVVGYGNVSDLDGTNTITFCAEQDIELYVAPGAGYDSTYNAVYYLDAVGGAGFSIAYYDTVFYGISGAAGLASDDTLYVAIDNGICEGPRRMVVLDYQEPDSLVVTNSSPVNCGPSSITYISNLAVSSAGAYTYTWAPSSALSATTGSAVVATVNQTTNVSVTATDATGFCTVTEFSPVSVYGFPVVVPTALNDSICPGGQTTLSSNTSSTGFTIVSTGYSPTPGSNITTIVSNSVINPAFPSVSLDDGVWTGIPIGFTYNFLGNDYTTVGIGTNGNIQFGPTYSTSFTPTFGALAPNNFIALFWSDLNLNTGNGPNSIRYWTSGTAPNRVFSVSIAAGRFGTAGALQVSGQIDLFETTGLAVANIQEMDASAFDNVIVGCENVDGTIGSAAPGRTDDTWSVSTPEAWQFIPPVNYSFSWLPTSAISGAANTSTVIAQPTAYTNYQLIVTDNSTGCDNSINNQTFIDVAVATADPVASFVANDLTATTGGVLQTVNFTNNTVLLGGETFVWTFSPNTVQFAGSTNATSANPQVQFMEPGNYSVTLTVTSCTGTNSLVRTNYISVTPEYCFPEFGTPFPFDGCDDGDGVGNVRITNPASVIVMEHLNTGCTTQPGAYQEFAPVAGVTTATLYQGTTYSMQVTSISPAFSEFFAAYLDVDDDGDFNDPLEFLGGNSSAAVSATFDIGIPTSNVSYGPHRLRVIAAFGTGPLDANDACIVTTYGEAHDYFVNIQPPVVLNDIPAFATNVQYSVNLNYPTCYPINASTALASNSPESAGSTGNDLWFRFTAQSTGVSITLTSATMDDYIGLYSRDLAGNYNVIATENAGTGAGDFERLNVTGLTAGTQYWISVGSAAAGAGGAFSLCIQNLMPSSCAYAIPAGGFRLCDAFKAVYRGAPSQGVTYNFTFTPVLPTLGVATSLTGTNGLITLSNAALGLRYGGVYNAKVDVLYTLFNAASTPVAEPILVQGNPAAPTCTNIPIQAHPLMEVRSSQRCPATLLRSNFLVGTTVAGSTSSAVCGAINYSYEFTQVVSCADGTLSGVPDTLTTVAATPYLGLGVLGNLPNAGAWNVRIRPNFSYGPGTFGPVQRILVNNTSASIMLDEEVAEMDEKVDSFVAANLYPNPNNGEMVNLNVSGIESDNVFVRITDAMGRIVYTNRFAVEGSLNTIVTFAEPLASGIYNVEFTVDGQIMTERMIVAKQ